MKNYKLQPNEVVLYQAQVTLQTEKGDVPTDLILTDLNFIFVTPRKKFLWMERKPRATAFAKETVKIYMDAPQIKQTGTSVKICFATEDRTITFAEKKDARNFVINAWEVVTGKNLFQYGLDKLKDALELINDKLNLDLIKLVKDVLANRLVGKAANVLQGAAQILLPKKKD